MEALEVLPELQNWITLVLLPKPGEFFDHLDSLARQLRYDEPFDRPGYEE